MGTIRLFNHPIKKLLLLLIGAEATLLVASTYLGVYLRFATDPQAISASVGSIWPRAAVFGAVMMLSLAATGLYNLRLRDGFEGILVRLVLSFVLGTVLLSLIFYVVPPLLLGRGALALALLSAFGSLVMTRAIFLNLLAQQNIKRRVLVLGAGRRALSLALLRRKSDLIGLNVVGYLPTPGDQLAVDSHKIIRTDLGLSELVARHRIDEIIVAVDDRRDGLPMSELLQCRTAGVDVVDLLTFLEHEMGKIKLDLMYPSWLAFSQGFRHGLLRALVKRTFDIGVSLSLLVIALPIMLVTALAIWAESGFRGPILYRQIRVGEGGREFPVLKFRSMRLDAEKDGKARWAQSNDPRVTRVGAFIRKYRIDELPQILNVLRGEMSFVGPRPERPQFVQGLKERFPYYAERHQVKPGLTGWAQICYPYGASENDAFEKLQYDLYYVKNHSLFLDLTIMLQTAEVVLWGKGAR
jgi:sugar transferase (PEP-CTERM system associated)